MMTITTREAWVARYAQRMSDVHGVPVEAGRRAAQAVLENGGYAEYSTPEEAAESGQILVSGLVDHEGATCD
jgi:hypothetical protein